MDTARPQSIDDVPGYRRRLRVTPSPGRVLSELEDDYHCMAVTVLHDGRAATAVEAVMDRAPWNTCPGAVAVLTHTFIGIALEKFASRGEKQANCTHLHDLAVLAAAHAFDAEATLFDILVSDPLEGRSRAELRRNGATVLSWSVAKGRIVEPAPLAGIELDDMRDWIKSLDPQAQEAARLLRWGTMVAHGRTLPPGWASWGSRMGNRGRCYTFQPHRVGEIKHTGAIRDFSRGAARPLEQDPTPSHPQSCAYAGRRTP